MSHQTSQHQNISEFQRSRRNNSNINNNSNSPLPYSDADHLNIDSISEYYTTTATATTSHHLYQQGPSFFPSSPSPYNSTSSPHINNPAPLNQLSNSHNPIERPKYPWNLPSAASSVISTADFSGSTAYPPSIDDKRRLIHSWNSRPQSSIMDPNDSQHNQFTAIELHSQQFAGTGTGTAVRSGQPSISSNELASLSPRTTKRPASIYSTTERVRLTKKKQGFWANITPKKFSFRPDGVKKPKKANSYGNKKAKFSNERTMVHWIKASMLMGGLAMTLLSFGDNNITPYIGVTLLVICLTMLIYSTTVFQVRMEWLNMRRKDVRYYDRFAPTVLTFFLFVTFAFNGIISYTGDFKANKDYLKQ